MGHTLLRVPAFHGADAALLERRQRRLGHTLLRVPAFRCARGADAAMLERRQRRLGHTLLRVPAAVDPASRLRLPRAIAADMRRPLA
jgi:hypothetical protein